jgi:hypothetical protein
MAKLEDMHSPRLAFLEEAKSRAGLVKPVIPSVTLAL